VTVDRNRCRVTLKQIELLTAALVRAQAVAMRDVVTAAHIDSLRTDIAPLKTEWRAACGDQAATSTSAAILAPRSLRRIERS
jgi:hypothetical protein